MKSFGSKLCLGCIILILFAGNLVFAGEKDNADKPKSPFFSDFLWQWNEVEKKLTDLAEAIPQEKYSWRPAEGVRSVSEVVVHVAGGNYYLPSFIGVKPPEGFSPDAEKTVTNKAEAIKMLGESFEHFRHVILSKSDEDLDAPADIFGNKTTVRNAFFLILSHTHEHLGQLIAYARMNGVVPPWSAKQSEQEKE
jgi:uncharacterized damage-inducible protein DinB